MEPVRRLRIFAGPNGSGKTTIVNDLKTRYSFGAYINADDIEALLVKERTLLLTKYQIQSDTKDIQDFFKTSSLSPVKLNLTNI
jgi:predicted ABC-type ATPase